MSARALLYHDVVPDADWTASGFPGADADIYKLSVTDFVEHLEALRRGGFAPSTIRAGVVPAHMLTFDDGGASALEVIAPELERRGWRGHFFVTTGCIGTPGFLDAAGVRELHARGHVVGSHSVTHPHAMAACSAEQLAREWTVSLEQLGSVLAANPTVASIPGGWYSRAVAEAAHAAGIRHLFSSEPTARVWTVGRVTCLGRYTIWRGTSPQAAVALGLGRGLGPAGQQCAWTLKKLAKRTLGTRYTELRRELLHRRG